MNERVPLRTANTCGASPLSAGVVLCVVVCVRCRNIAETIRDEVHMKYVNKVIPDQGLCIALHGFDHKSDPFLYPNDGGAHVRVQFRLVVFRYRGVVVMRQ